MKKIKEILIGTNNIGKYKELCDLLPKKIKKYTLEMFDIISPKETGKTFKENSLIKASYFSKKTNLVCLSDDSGLEINILNGEPGIYSARWSGKKNNFTLAIKKVLEEIKKKSKKNNKAQFVCSLTLAWPNGKTYTSQNFIKGIIAEKPKGNKGFGYDPIFIPHGYKKTFGQMKPSLKNSIDHRSKAFAKIRKFFI